MGRGEVTMGRDDEQWQHDDEQGGTHPESSERERTIGSVTNI